ncbi:WhiB family transcriptional regulator [Streptosporangium canum]|uniref:WhiB family transcriptional regulator n=1 Tax=Streptosporangium canum TaxID=324952 RepID=UPI0037A5C3D6
MTIQSVGWQEDAACRGQDLALFYGPANDDHAEGNREREAREKKAKKICAPCTVREKCLAWNLSFGPHQYGIGGGLTGEERRKLRSTKASGARAAS